MKAESVKIKGQIKSREDAIAQYGKEINELEHGEEGVSCWIVETTNAVPTPDQKQLDVIFHVSKDWLDASIWKVQLKEAFERIQSLFTKNIGILQMPRDWIDENRQKIEKDSD